MRPMTVAEVAAAVGGVVEGADPEALVTGVGIDSRTVGAGELFVAVVGANHDGHDHVQQAQQRGAVAALVDRPVPVPAVVDGDTVEALGRLARASIDGLPDCLVVGVTGSSGKTSTKDLLAQVLGEMGATVAPPGSLNNEIGMPLTVLRADEGTRFLVAEMGMRGIGHIDYLCGIAPPRVAVVTNVGSAHAELLGSQDAIAQAKGELVRALPADGLAVLNGDDPRVAAMAQWTSARSLTYGESEGCDVRAEDVVLDALARPSFTLVAAGERVPVQLALHGRHQVSNALAAAAVAMHAGAAPAQAAAALGRAGSASQWRMEVSEAPSGAVVVNDAYNANPESMGAALRALAAMGQGRRTWAVLGEMRELGPGSVAAHEAVGALAAALGIDRVVAVGEGARPILVGAASLGAEALASVQDPEGAVALLGPVVGTGDVVLVKASRSIGLERVAVALLGAGTGEDSFP